MSQSFYRALLRLYPASYRVEYEPELVRAFEESTRGEGALTRAFAALADVIPNALAVHGGILRQATLQAANAAREAVHLVTHLEA